MRRTIFQAPTLRATALASCFAAIAAPHATLAAAVAAAPTAPPATEALTVKDAAALDAAIAERLEAFKKKQGAWQWRDFVDRGRVAIGEGDFAGAATCFECASHAAPDAATRVMSDYCWGNALISAAQVMPPIDKKTAHPNRTLMLARGGSVLNAAQQLVPLSRDVAASRVTAWSALGDNLETMAAEHQMRVIDPTLEGIPRCEPTTLMVIAVVLFIGGGVVLRTVDLSNYMNPEQRLMLLSACDRGAKIAGMMLIKAAAGSEGAEAAEVFTTEMSQ